jgi:hypothetical protein
MLFCILLCKHDYLKTVKKTKLHSVVLVAQTSVRCINQIYRKLLILYEAQVQKTVLRVNLKNAKNSQRFLTLKGNNF